MQLLVDDFQSQLSIAKCEEDVLFDCSSRSLIRVEELDIHREQAVDGSGLHRGETEAVECRAGVDVR